MRESLESKRYFVDYKIQCVNASNGIKKNHADKNIKQNTCINTISILSRSQTGMQWWNRFVAQIFSSLVVVAECKQKSKDGCSVNHRLIKNTGRYFESRHKSHVNTNYYDELDTSGNVRSGSSTVKFPIPFILSRPTNIYNAVIKSRSMKWKV